MKTSNKKFIYNPDAFLPKQIAEGIYLYRHRIVGIMHFSNVFSSLKRYKIIKAFMEQGSQYYAPSCFGDSFDFGSAPHYNEIINGRVNEITDGISPTIRAVLEPDNKYDTNAFSLRINSSKCYSSNTLKLIGMNPNVFLDVGYLPKKHKDFILDDFAEYYLVGMVPDKRGFIVELILCSQALENMEVIKAIAASKNKEKSFFKNISHMSLRKIRSSLEVD